MPTPIMCTAFFGSDEGWGWSETHHVSGDTPVGPLLPYLAAFKDLMETKRVPLLGKDRYLQGIRVAFRPANGGISSSAYRYAPLRYPGNQREGSAPHLAAKVRMGEANNQQFSDIYLRGFWDAAEADEELQLTVGVGALFKGLLDQYVSALVGGAYGWLGLSEADTRRGAVTAYSTDADGFILFTLGGIVGPALPAVGTKLSFRAARINNSNSVLNRTHIVTVASATTVKTVSKTAAGEFQSAGTFVIAGTSFLAYTGAQYTVLARRAAGAPFFHSPGRSKARARS